LHAVIDLEDHAGKDRRRLGARESARTVLRSSARIPEVRDPTISQKLADRHAITGGLIILAFLVFATLALSNRESLQGEADAFQGTAIRVEEIRLGLALASRLSVLAKLETGVSVVRRALLAADRTNALARGCIPISIPIAVSIPVAVAITGLVGVAVVGRSRVVAAGDDAATDEAECENGQLKLTKDRAHV